MGDAIKSEFRKFFTTRMWWGMAIAMFIGGALFAVILGFVLTIAPTQESVDAGQPTGSPLQIANSVYTAGLTIGYTLTLVIGIMQIGSEYRHKTVTSTFLSTPRRMRVMLAKVVALLGIGAVYGLISLIGSVIAGAIVLQSRGADPFPSTEVLRALALSLLVLGLWALIGLGVGILIPNQVAALLISIGVAWIIEPLAGFALSFWDFGREHIVHFLPGQATNAMVSGVSQGGDNAVQPLSWWAAALVLAAYAAVMSAIGTWRTVRQDIS
ncbi:Putative ABC transport system membrane protein [Janibacter sp. HTCC2649]|uniref:ABC transporter permease subunit n=1 Tax=Janibacter sp. HTCC2649 TaxID=313589 RepID=UPI00006708F4|nr:ABC transporter permease subunit [Janibacter sp. HTCC2649]EAP99928.1 Putative ABC transport system membrane protein [Janibacter sp. HTCC2649]